MAILMEGQAPRSGAYRIGTHTALIGVLVATILLLRLSSLTYNSAFVDEAANVVVGQRVLAGDFRDNGLRWLNGSYLYPMVAAVSAQWFEDPIIGPRALSALLNTASALAVYAVTRRLWNPFAGLFAMLIFAFTGVSRFVGSFATYDSLGIAAIAGVTALLLYGILSESTSHQRRWFLGAGLLFSAAVLSKYFALAFLPVVGLLVLILAVTYRHTARAIAIYMLLPMVGVLGVFVASAWDSLLVFAAEFRSLTAQPATRIEILGQISRTMRVPYVLAAIGTISLLMQRDRRNVIALSLLWCASLIPPASHLWSSSVRSMDKSMAYTLIFLAPLAGLGLVALMRWIQERISFAGGRWIALAFLVAYLLIAVKTWEDQAWIMQQRWPNVQPVVHFLQQAPIAHDTRILAEGGGVYDLYLGSNREVALIDTWATYFTYSGLQGERALEAAVADRYFDYVILDGYFTPELSARLKQAAVSGGYVLAHRSASVVSGVEQHTITVEVYSAEPLGEFHDSQPSDSSYGPESHMQRGDS